LERLGKRGLRCASEPTRQTDKSSHQACVFRPVRLGEMWRVQRQRGSLTAIPPRVS
jgi:hypothetical protein